MTPKEDDVVWTITMKAPRRTWDTPQKVLKTGKDMRRRLAIRIANRLALGQWVSMHLVESFEQSGGERMWVMQATVYVHKELE
jgi:hypothetical protein